MYALTTYTDGAIEEVIELYENEIITLTATDSGEKAFVQWVSDDETITSTDKAIIFTMPGNDTVIRANFE